MGPLVSLPASKVVFVAVEIGDLQRVWPAELFVSEARSMRELGYRDDRDLGWLLDEAFANGLARELFQAVGGFNYRGTWQPPIKPATLLDPWGPDPWAETETNGYRPSGDTTGPPASLQLVDHLIAIAHEIPQVRRRRYYRERQRPPESATPVGWEDTRTAIGQCLEELNDTGYFDRAFGSTCTEADSDPISIGNAVLLDRVVGDTADQAEVMWWPPTPATVQEWDLETTLGVVEALFDLVARPRVRDWHDYAEEWDYADLSRSAGQQVYLWKLNTVLDESGISLRLATAGVDRGLLVEVVADDREGLLVKVLDHDAPEAARERIEHAVATFRQRGGATRADKRAAILSLHHLLESRRAALKIHLSRRDEGALFQIANEFDLRHHDGKQRDEYGDEFLDWIFWWYLATVDLLHRVAERGNP